ncbi:PREDICTED: uncharacterized protein LOC106338295 [Brassica oleracea var. oleracea]|uniref:uncharacterized protein LOC106321199 n=1 Tax=Brassica oleracea var. oleracea TaxID=109376 RepID=UPI0006A6DC79|nr:PREDICTED: uncharacterized protein LOC106321199 [Brassica oleracea var. oleracea]XP_013632764.1 PREDICTED: uncharacterized protein LOC106338295 [Brassica oleracea var. oleracea]
MNRIINEQGTAISVKTNSISTKKAKLPLQDHLNPGRTYSNRSAIKLPKDDTKKSGVSLEYLFLVRQNPFRGNVSEHPHDHIEYLKDMMDDKKWLDQLPAGSLTCWKEIRNTFINHFFNETRYWDVRKKISTFRQDPRESFKNAWERFKSYQLECPHHGYSEPQLINTFYGGINLHYQITLDTASEGSFSTRNSEEAKRLIKNVATEQQVDFVDVPTLKDRYHIPNTDSFTQIYDATVGSSRGKVKFRLNQAFTGNRKMATDLNGKINIVYGELMRNFDALNEHIKRLDGQVAENVTAIKRETGRLLGRTDSNPKRQSQPRIRNFSREGQSNTKEAAIDLEEEEEELEEDVEIDRQEGNNVDRPTTVNIDRQTGNNVDRDSAPAETAVDRVYRTLPPFPPNKTQTKRELDKAICKKAFDKITLDMPLSDAIKVSPSIKKYVKDMVSNSFPAAEHSVTIVSKEVSEIIQGETPINGPDPGSFVLDCNIRNKSFPRSLCELGSSVNLMPHCVVISLGYDKFKPTKITLVLADRSVRVPEGVLDELPIRINDCHVPTDFVVLKYQNEPKDPLILGRPFLATAGAIIDIKEGRICLNIGNIPMTSDMEKMIKRPLIDKQISYVDDISELAEESFIDLCSDDPLEKVLTSTEEETFSVDNRADEYVRLMDASIEIANVDEVEDDTS